MVWQVEPATEKQRRYLRFVMRCAGLRCSPPADLRKGEAVEMITKLERAAEIVAQVERRCGDVPAPVRVERGESGLRLVRP